MILPVDVLPVHVFEFIKYTHGVCFRCIWERAISIILLSDSKLYRLMWYTTIMFIWRHNLYCILVDFSSLSYCFNCQGKLPFNLQ